MYINGNPLQKCFPYKFRMEVFNISKPCIDHYHTKALNNIPNHLHKFVNLAYVLVSLQAPHIRHQITKKCVFVVIASVKATDYTDHC